MRNATDHADVAFDVTAGVLQQGGIGRHAAQLAQRLALGRYAERFRMFAAGWSGAAHMRSTSGWLPPARVHSVGRSVRGYRTRLLTSHWLGAADDRRWGDPLLLHSPDAYAPFLRGAVTIVTVHDLSYRLLPQCHTMANRLFLEEVVTRSVRRAMFVLADSEATRRDVERLLGVEPDRVRVIYPGVITEVRTRDREVCVAEVRERWKLNGGFVLCVGTIEPRKNHSFLIEAFGAFVRASGYLGELVVVGHPGWGHVRLESHAMRFGVSDRLRILTDVSDAELDALYGACDVFALPSLYEGFGLPVVEAMKSGAPIVVSDRGSLPEIVGEAGLVLAPDDPDRWAAAFAGLLLPQARVRARDLGPRRAIRFDYDRAAREIENLYDECLSEARRFSAR